MKSRFSNSIAEFRMLWWVWSLTIFCSLLSDAMWKLQVHGWRNFLGKHHVVLLKSLSLVWFRTPDYIMYNNYHSMVWNICKWFCINVVSLSRLCLYSTVLIYIMQLWYWHIKTEIQIVQVLASGLNMDTIHMIVPMGLSYLFCVIETELFSFWLSKNIFLTRLYIDTSPSLFVTKFVFRMVFICHFVLLCMHF